MKVSSPARITLWMALVLAVGITISWLIEREQSKDVDKHVVRALTDASRELENDLLARLRVYEYRLRGMRGAVHMLDANNVSTHLMRRYSRGRNLDKEYPGARGFGFIRRVASADEAQYVAQIRRGGQPDFKVKQFKTHEGERFIIQFIDPVERNAQAIGLDIASEALRRRAAVDSMRNGQATLTAPITLLQDAGQKLSSFLFLLPVYSTPEMPPESQREAMAIGWTYAPLVMREVMGNLNLPDHRLHLKLYDVASAGEQLIYETQEDGPEPELLHTRSFEREVYGRLWRIEVSAHPLFVDAVDPTPPGRFFLIGLVASILLTGLVGTLLVARQRKQQVAAEQGRLATIVENSSDAIIGEALDGRIITWNRAAEVMFGYAEAEVLGRPLAPLLVPASRLAEDEELLERIGRGDRGAPLETQRLHKSGRLIDVTITCSFIREADGRILGAAKMMHDISDSKRVQRYLMEFNAELEQQVSERTAELSRVAGLLQTVLDASSEVSIIATDVQGEIIVFNRGAQLLLGYSAEETIGRKSVLDFHLQSEIGARVEELAAEYGDPLEDVDVFRYKPDREGAETRQWTYVRKDGSQVPVSMVVTPIRMDSGELSGYLGIAQDITERLQSSEQLHAAKAQAEAANAAKSLFLANMSHEIRTPMNAVIGVAHLLQNTPLDDQQRMLLGKLQIAGRSLLGIINDILDIAKIEAGAMKLEHAPFSPRQLMDDLVQLFTPQAELKGLQFTVETAGPLPNLLLGDALRINQILMNLIGNALKFTAKGSVKVTLDCDQQRDARCWLHITVADTGCGIAHDVAEQLFSPFTQADASTTRRFGGTGLGLSVVRGLAEQMGGRVGVHSQLGTGSEFTVDLPLQMASESDEHARSDKALDVWLLSDGLSEAQQLTRIAKDLGWRTTHVESPTDFQALLERPDTQEHRLPDALLASLDQAQLLRQVMQRCGCERLPLVLIMEQTQQLAMQREPLEPWQRVVPSPVDGARLFNAVNECLVYRDGDTTRINLASEFDTSVARWLEGMEVLLVDDSAINLEVASLLLAQQGAQVQTCSNGREALERLERLPDHFDAVLMDVQMPEMDGYEATRRLRDDLGLALLPVLALTAGAMAEERQQAQAAGMDDFLTKPLEPSALIRALRLAVERKRGGPLPVLALSSPRKGPDDWPSIPGIDGQDVANRLGDDQALFLSSLKRFFADFVEFADHRLLSQPSHELVARLHKLRGTAALLGAKELAARAGNVEQLLRDGAADAATRPALEALLAAYAELDGHTRLLRDKAPSLPVDDIDQTQAQQALVMLEEQLRNRDMAALDSFAHAASAIREMAGDSQVAEIWQAIDNLDYALALVLLDQARAKSKER
ncbi:CHASE domain-containing hybrid sensor histidine kinase/response regulator [Pseudomonas sp. CNPSo 3701]|uniref:CHASE domain-containing hybrid sensor histidine kinase/response regulator n=1 Tax=Pseudomonas sp. CNPSo 3701 TaxID=3027943 RepID=UPI002363BD02|nr:CHASE domain-containing protein [Pseudomonas sp. CNPSo 3701]MDD1509077.1 CHASE domain-containing protein [Pseudomonas sp. CNPSo 3701]